MTPLDALLELLERVGAGNGIVLVSETELNGWPAEAVRELKAQKLLAKASPAKAVVCPGCERECVMPVHTVSGGMGESASFIVCDKRDDINRVAVPEATLRQWSATLAAFAGLVARLLGTTGTGTVTGKRWELGVLKGRKHSSHVALVADGGLSLHVAGHTVALADVLILDSKVFRLDKQEILKLVDKPIAGAGDQESARQRRERLARLVRVEKDKENPAFLKTVAQNEGISVSRLKQILSASPKKAPTPRNWRN